MPILMKKLLNCRKGNFSITTAFLLPVLLMVVGLALDYTEMSRKREVLQQAVDAAALSAASTMATNGTSAAGAQALAISFLKGHMATTSSAALDLQPPVIDITQTSVTTHSKSFKVKVTDSYNVQLSGFQTLLGISHARVTAVGTAESSTESRNPLSMYLVLDRSGSMQWVTSTVDTSQSSCYNYYEYNWPTATYQHPCYVKKIDSLKLAVSALASTFETADPTHELVRLGAVSYSTVAATPLAPVWGSSSAKSYVNALTASGGTNSTPGFQIAYNALMSTTEDQAHMAKTGLVPSKYIVLMTDGSNDNSANDATTKSLCDAAKTGGIKVYTVAFDAPDRGKALLSYCASGTDYYFEAASVPQLVAAFQAIGDKTSRLSNRLTQ